MSGEFRLDVVGSSGRLDAVTPGVLRGVERAVGRSEQQVGLAGIIGHHRDPERRGDAAIDTGYRERRYLRPELLGNVERAGAVGVGQQDGELLAAEAPDEVASANGARRDRPDGREDVVPLAVAIGVVDRLEAVEVEYHQRER